MLIKKSGEIDKETNAVLLANGNLIEHDENQWYQETQTGKRLELWQRFEDGRELRVKYWNLQKSIICYYKVG